jgi:hypothetical protein
MPESELSEMTTMASEVFTSIIQLQALHDSALKHHYVDPHLNGNHIRFENIFFPGDTEGVLTIQTTTQAVSLHFISCKFNTTTITQSLDLVLFTDCQVTSVIVNNATVKRLVLNNTESTLTTLRLMNAGAEALEILSPVKGIEITGQHNSNYIKITANTLIDQLDITQVKPITIQGQPRINKCVLEGSTYPFTEPVAIKNLTINNNSDTKLRLTGLFEQVEINYISADLYLDNFTCLGSFYLKNHNKPKQAERLLLEMSDVYIGHEFRITRSDAILRSELDHQANRFILIHELNIRENLNGLSLRSVGEQPIYVNKISFDDIYFGKEVYWTLQWVFCSALSFNNFKNAGTGNIIGTLADNFKPLDMSFEKMYLIFKDNSTYKRYFSSSGNIDYNTWKKKREFILKFSDLGKINFIDSDLSEFRMLFYSTKISEIFLAGSKMPKEVEAFDIGRQSADLKHQRRIANSQLKKLHEQQGDMVAANEYFANEMNAYYESLNWRKNFWEKSPLFLNKYSSNHGQSWSIGLLTTLSISILIYVIFIFSFGYAFADPGNREAMSSFFKLASYFPDFINPLHKLDTFNDLQINPFSPATRFIDAIGRIVIAYLVYQLIQAFRKHGRSK